MCNEKTFVGLALGLGIGLIIAAVLLFLNEKKHHIEAIERGYALYCPVTGNFAWKGECDE